ncbi:MAG: response regulator [Deltaproteobacteria bacterium]|nr:response regulator [Deltaproteobacteria bacterium]
MSKNILIVDDCDTTRKLISYMVKGAGYNPIGAVNGFDALEKLAQNEISLVVTDLNMPQMDGLELARNIKTDENYKGMPVIMLTTESSEKDKETGLQAGVDVYMTKPVTSKWLAYQIQKLL